MKFKPSISRMQYLHLFFVFKQSLKPTVERYCIRLNRIFLAIS
jgi:hypothetical protein